MEKLKIWPLVKFTPIKFSRSNSAHVTTSWTSTPVPNFIAISVRGASPKYVKYYAFVTFWCPVLSWLYFFLATPPRSNPWTDFNRLWLKWRVVTQGCAFWGFGSPPTILRGSKPPKIPKKGAWLGIFLPKWQNHKIVISPAGNIGSIPNFGMVIEPHSWLRGPE